MSLISRLRGEPAPPVVPVLRLEGVIGRGMSTRRAALSLADLARPIERAFKTKRAAAVALLINSPGGSPVQSSLIASRIRARAEEKDLKVYAFCEDVAASGGYWLALAADEVYADASSILGSIGVVYSSFGFVDLIAKLGIERRTHTAGERKAILDPFVPEREDDIGHLRHVQGEIHRAFIDHVKSRRGDALKGSEAEMFSGAFWAGHKALEMGLIDGIGDLRGVMRQKLGKKVRLRLVNPPRRRRRWPFGASASISGGALDAVDRIAAELDDRAMWSRYGL